MISDDLELFPLITRRWTCDYRSTSLLLRSGEEAEELPRVSAAAYDWIGKVGQILTNGNPH